jgi:hypothetical protein
MHVDHEHDELLEDPDEPEPGVTYAPSLTVEEVVTSHCSTAPVRGISEQIAEEIECMRPDTMASISGIDGLSLGAATLPYMQKAAATSLRNAARARQGIFVTSGLRSTVQQYILHRWYTTGRCSHVVIIAAPPGGSNHESGLAIDIVDANSWRPHLERHGYLWFGPDDPVHFDYVAGGSDIRHLSVLAFQRLWNRNHPGDRIAEDGSYGAATEARLRRSPAAGFARGPRCAPMPSDSLPIEVYWARGADGTYALRALAPESVQRVEYRVDGYKIGEASRDDGSNFPDSYRFSEERDERHFEVIGFDAAGKRIARGVGLFDVTSGTGIYIKQMGSRLYEVGLERAPADVAFISLDVDGFPVTDAETGEGLSPRNAVRSTYSMLGERTFRITTHNADGSERGHLHRTFRLE